MIKHYFKQALQMLKENPLVNTISILGTALSIAMIMVVILVAQISVAEYTPESYRNNMLYILSTQAHSDQGQNNNGRMSAEVVKECFYTLQKPKAVTAICQDNRAISLPAKQLYKEYSIKYADPGFWKAFDFGFIYGNSFSDADFQSGIPTAVITSDVASELFGTKNAVGETIIIDFIAYKITGIVKPVSKAANHAYAEVWVPYTATPSLMENPYNEGISGPFITVILANTRSDFDDIKKELEQRTMLYNEGKKDFKVNFMNNPITRLDIAAGANGFRKVDINDYLLSTGGVLLFLLLIPALNITGVMQSSIHKRRGEIGVRKAFGATYGKLVQQILYENLIITLIGGCIGLILSFFLLEVTKSFMLTTGETMLTTEMLFKPGLFFVALLFTLLLNLLSAGIPAVRISRQQIVDALKDNEN
ncbi:MAG: ABC transporter permease [Tannerella sp.]|jgi:putative ABC transport system permease protein|nr:ABC transporter permease [Tannerella sp.]